MITGGTARDGDRDRDREYCPGSTTAVGAKGIVPGIIPGIIPGASVAVIGGNIVGIVGCMMIGCLSGLRLLLRLSRRRGGDPCGMIIGAGPKGAPITGKPVGIVAMGGGESER